MIIKDLKTFVVGNPPPHFGWRYFIFLKLITNSGIEGVGEVYCSTFAPHVIVKMIEDVFEMHVKGIDPFHIEKLWRNVYGRGYTLRPDLSLIGVLSGPAANELLLPRIFLKQVRTSGIAMANHQSQKAMVEYLENSKIKPVISDTFDLAELAGAFQHQIDNKHFGKISISME